MVDQVADRYGRASAEWLIDGGFPAHDHDQLEKTRLQPPHSSARQNAQG